LNLLKDEALQHRLGGFNFWEQEKDPVKTDLASLEQSS